MKLVLFDIDGTLLLSGGAGRRAINRALDEVFGAAGSQEHPLDGKTDPQIVRELMRMAGHDDDYIDAHMNELFERYVELLHEEFLGPNHGAYALPGVPALLDALEARSDVILGLLTGNVIDGPGTLSFMWPVDQDGGPVETSVAYELSPKGPETFVHLMHRSPVPVPGDWSGYWNGALASLKEFLESSVPTDA